MNTEEAVPMERRVHTRHRAKTRVFVRQGKTTKMCKAINLSANGVAIQTNGMGLKPRQTVELCFAIDLGVVVKIHRREAEVRHVKNGVTGFSMHPFGSNNYNVTV